MSVSRPVWIYNRTICSGLGDRLGALLTVAALAHISNVDVEMEWCNGELSRVYGNFRTHIPQWEGFNYSRVEFLETFTIPQNIRLVDSFENRHLPAVSYTTGELPADEGRDQVYTLASRTTHLSKPVHPLHFTRAYFIVGSHLQPRFSSQDAAYVVVHVRAPGKNTYAPRYVRDLSLFCTKRVVKSILREKYKVIVVSDDHAYAAQVIPLGALTVSNGNSFDDFALLLGATGIVQHAATGYSSYSSVPSMAHGIPLINTYKGEDHRYYIFHERPVEFHTCGERKQFLSRLSAHSVK